MANECKNEGNGIDVYLPPRNGEGECEKICGKQSIVLIGANGAGKTRMSVWIEQNNPKKNPKVRVHRVSAQHSLEFPESVWTTDVEKLHQKLVYGPNSKDTSEDRKNIYRWNSNPDTAPLKDAELLLQYLVSDSYERYLEHMEEGEDGDKTYYNTSLMMKVAKIWNDVITHRTIGLSSGKIIVYESGDKDKAHSYNAAKLSDGEREIFYIIGQVLSAYPHSIIIIDEPETHLHKSILENLWDMLEEERGDCVFLYITHDYDFAISRENAQLVWVQAVHDEASDKGDKIFWEYKILPENGIKNYTDSIQLQIYGCRKDILFVEGEENSIDKRLYSKIYPEYVVYPMGSCDAVEHAVETYRRTKELNYVDVNGIVDNDRRTDEEIKDLEGKGIYVLDVAVVENLFILPEVVTLVAQKMEIEENPEEVNIAATDNIFKYMSDEKILDELVLLYSKEIADSKIADIYKGKGQDKGEERIYSEDETVNFTQIMRDEKDRLRKIIEDKDLHEAMRVMKNKGLLSESKIPDAFKFKRNDYINQVIRYTGDNDETGKKLRAEFKKHIRLK